MSKFFLKNVLSTGKTSILNKLFNARADKLAEVKTNIPIEDKERFLDVVSNVENEELRKRLIAKYLQDEDYLGYECGRLSEEYYKIGVADGISLIMECTKVGVNNG